jgi:DNA polymerase III alpha subunit
MSNNQANTWTFTGRVVRVETRNTKTGKGFRNLTISQPDGQYTRLCVCTLWGERGNGLHEGAEITATGRIDGREYNGKHYAGLTATAIETHGAQPAERLAEPERVRSVDRANAELDAGADMGWLPF